MPRALSRKREEARRLYLTGEMATNSEIAARVGVKPHTVGDWRRKEILDPLAKFSLSPEWPRVERIVIERQGDLLRFHPYDGRGKPAADFFSSSNFSLPG